MLIQNLEFCLSNNDEVNDKVLRFTDQMDEPGQSLVYYEEKRNASRSKARLDQLFSKKSEFIVSYALHEHHSFPLLLPDLEIRCGRNKSWKCDLPYEKEGFPFPNVHVKVCTPYTVRIVKDYSWSIQVSNADGSPGGRDAILDLPDTTKDMIALVFMEKWESPHGIIKAMLPWVEIRKFLKPPVSRKHIGRIECLYFEDIQCVAN